MAVDDDSPDDSGNLPATQVSSLQGDMFVMHDWSPLLTISTASSCDQYYVGI